MFVRVCFGPSVRGGVEGAVAGVAESGDNVALFVEAFVDGADEDAGAGEGLLDAFDAFGGGEETEEAGLFDAPGFEIFQGGNGTTAGGEHGVEDKGDIDGASGGEFLIIGDGLKGALVAVEAEMPDFCVGQEVEKGIHHGEAGTENGDNPDSAAEFVSGGGLDGGLDVDGFGFETAGGFGDQKGRETADGLAEAAGSGLFVAERAQGIGGDGVLKGEDWCHGLAIAKWAGMINSISFASCCVSKKQQIISSEISSCHLGSYFSSTLFMQ